MSLGAACQTLDEMKAKLEATERKLMILPLNPRTSRSSANAAGGAAAAHKQQETQAMTPGRRRVTMQDATLLKPISENRGNGR